MTCSARMSRTNHRVYTGYTKVYTNGVLRDQIGVIRRNHLLVHAGRLIVEPIEHIGGKGCTVTFATPREGSPNICEIRARSS